jgi:hypothetical protein
MSLPVCRTINGPRIQTVDAVEDALGVTGKVCDLCLPQLRRQSQHRSTAYSIQHPASSSMRGAALPHTLALVVLAVTILLILLSRSCKKGPSALPPDALFFSVPLLPLSPSPTGEFPRGVKTVDFSGLSGKPVSAFLSSMVFRRKPFLLANASVLLAHWDLDVLAERGGGDVWDVGDGGGVGGVGGVGGGGGEGGGGGGGGAGGAGMVLRGVLSVPSDAQGGGVFYMHSVMPGSIRHTGSPGTPGSECPYPTGTATGTGTGTATGTGTGTATGTGTDTVIVTGTGTGSGSGTGTGTVTERISLCHQG